MRLRAARASSALYGSSKTSATILLLLLLMTHLLVLPLLNVCQRPGILERLNFDVTILHLQLGSRQQCARLFLTVGADRNFQARELIVSRTTVVPCLAE